MSDLDDARKRKLEVMPRKLRGLFRRAWAGRSRKSAIRANCAECCGYKLKEIDNCTSLACAMYPYRPKFEDTAEEPEILKIEKDPAKVERAKAMSAARKAKEAKA